VLRRRGFFHKLYENCVFRRGVDEVFVLLGCYAAQLDTSLPTFRHNVLVSFSTVTQASGRLLAPLQMVPIRRLEASVANYQVVRCNNPQQRKCVQNLLTKRSPRFRSTENSEIVIATAAERCQYRNCHFRWRDRAKRFTKLNGRKHSAQSAFRDIDCLSNRTERHITRHLSFTTRCLTHCQRTCFLVSFDY